MTKIPTLRVVTRRVKNVCFGHLDLEIKICFEIRIWAKRKELRSYSIFEFYIMQYISREGLEELKVELKQRFKARLEIAKSLEEAKGQGDLSENAEYAEAKENQAFNEGRIMELEQMIKTAMVITKNRKDDKVSVGTVVKTKSGEETAHFHIVGSEEADPAKGKISNESPLGKALLGRKIGETTKAETPRGKVKYKILGIE